jgi:putative endonuclease
VKLVSSTWYVYLLECENNRLYTGITPDLALRFKKHLSGKGAMFTRLNRPRRMIAAYPCDSRSSASRLEIAIKQLTPVQKLQITSCWPMQSNLPARVG